MRHKLTPRRTYGSGRLVVVSIHVTRDLCELLELSARQSGLTRSAEVNRLLLLALGRAPAKAAAPREEIRGHIV